MEHRNAEYQEKNLHDTPNFVAVPYPVPYPACDFQGLIGNYTVSLSKVTDDLSLFND